MATPLKDRIRAAAIASAPITAIVGTNPFRWYDRQLNQGSVLPAVVVQEVSNPQQYALVGRFPTSFSRVQFTLWSVNTALGMARLAALETALLEFFESLNLVGIPGLCSYSNQVVNARDGFFATPEPGNPSRILDVMIFANDGL